jgi:pimeloyl-ACP methyl ester carboxylesterase
MEALRTQLRGWGRLAIDGTVGLTDVVEAMHREIATPFPLRSSGGRTRGITGFVYRSIRWTARLVGAVLDEALDQIGTEGAGQGASGRAEAALAIVNGVAGDYLAATSNPLAIRMRLRRGGRELVLDSGALASTIPDAQRRVVVLVHGSCLNDLSWARVGGHDHGAELARDLGRTAIYLHYNTGLHVSTNGQLLSELLEQLVHAWPVPLEGITIVAHSMGGLVARSACHYASAAGRSWPGRLDGCFFLGTPHLGAPLERAGRHVHELLRVSRYSAPLALLGGIRSAGVTDLRHGSVLDDDWRGRDRFGSSRRPTPVPLPGGVRCFAIAGCVARGGAVLGDGLVPVRSALGQHRDPRRALAFPESRRWVARGVGHIALLEDPGVYAFIRRSLEGAG